MTEDQKRTWESYEVLRKAASDRFTARTKFEYRVLMSFWAAIAVLIVLFLRQEALEWNMVYALAVSALAILSFVAWCLWTSGLNKAHWLDRRVSIFFEDAMMKSVGLEFSEDIGRPTRE